MGTQRQADASMPAGILDDIAGGDPASGTAQVSAIFIGENKQPLPSGEEGELIDTAWIYYDDGTFEQYAEVGDKAVLFSKGGYLLSGGDFATEPADGVILTIHRTAKYADGELGEWDSTHDYDLGELDFLMVYPR